MAGEPPDLEQRPRVSPSCARGSHHRAAPAKPITAALEPAPGRRAPGCNAMTRSSAQPCPLRTEHVHPFTLRPIKKLARSQRRQSLAGRAFPPSPSSLAKRSPLKADKQGAEGLVSLRQEDKGPFTTSWGPRVQHWPLPAPREECSQESTGSCSAQRRPVTHGQGMWSSFPSTASAKPGLVSEQAPNPRTDPWGPSGT